MGLGLHLRPATAGRTQDQEHHHAPRSSRDAQGGARNSSSLHRGSWLEILGLRLAFGGKRCQPRSSQMPTGHVHPKAGELETATDLLCSA